MKVAVLDDYQRVAAEMADWASLGIEVAFFDSPVPAERLPEALAEFDAVVLMRERTAFPREVLERLPQLRLLITTGMRNASVDAKYLAAERPEVTYCGTGMSGYGAGEAPGVNSTVEVAWSLILALVKRVGIEDRAIRSGRWQLGLPTTLAGRTLGLLGLGRLGSQMVPLAHAFGMDVIAWSENLTVDRADEVGARCVSKTALLESADIVSIHLVLSRRTRGLIRAAELALMKPTALLVNTSRGPIIDQAALVEALTAHTIAGAGLDVYDREPIEPDNPLLSLPNTVLLPHLGYATPESLAIMYQQAVEDIAAYQAGEPIRVIEA